MSAYVTMTIEGVAETKGSWIPLGNGRMKRDNPREKAWAEQVGWVAKLMMRGKMPLTSALVTLDFVLPPAHGRKNQRDVDKLARSCLDAMTGIVYVDDENVRGLVAMKEVGSRPICEINVWPSFGVRAADLVKFWIDEHDAYRRIGDVIRKETDGR